MNPECGVHQKVPFETYLAWDAIDYTFLKGMLHCPAYARYRRDNPSEERDCYRKGKLFHTLTLEPDNFKLEYALRPNTYRTTDGEERKWNLNSKVCQRWVAEMEGLTIVSEKDIADVSAMARSAHALPIIGKFLKGCDTELSVVWDDPATGLRCKARFDAYAGGCILDLKSTSGNADAGFQWEADSHRYWLQAAHYIDGMRAVGLAGKSPAYKAPLFVFVAVETYPPFLARAHEGYDDRDYELAWQFIAYGRMWKTSLMARAAECVKSGEWPGYSGEPRDLELTPKSKLDFENFCGG